jgi:hypothetical protein
MKSLENGLRQDFLDFNTLVLKSRDLQMTDPWVGHALDLDGSSFSSILIGDHFSIRTKF